MIYWKISTNTQSPEANFASYKGNFFSVITDSKINFHKINDKEYGIILDGYVLPILENNQLQKFSGIELVIKSIEHHPKNFISYLKGVFLLILITKESCDIYTDKLGLKKAFFSNEKGKVIFSNKMWEVKKETTDNFSIENIAINSLFNHYIEGKTIFNSIRYTNRAKHYQIFSDHFTEADYYDIKQIFELPKTKISTIEFANHFQKIVNQHIDLLGIRNPSVTLTGGFDSRIVLATLLSRGIKPVAFNYGNPASKDVDIAEKICQKFNLTFFNNSLKNVSPEWFDKLGEIIIEKGNSITQIHRAHRLDTVIKLMEKQQVDAIFGGYMGGEGILGIYYDDLITSEFVRRQWTENIPVSNLISEILTKKFIKTNLNIQQNVYSFVKQLPYFSDNQHLDHFLFSYRVKGEVHHVQDVNLFSNYVPFSIPIFLDIDYLKMLFSSEFNFLFKNNESRNPLTRINYYRYYAEMIRNIYPDLGSLPLAKTGFYTPDEYLSSKLVYMSKRLVRHFFTEPKYESNFKIDAWMYDYINQIYPVLEKSIVSEFTDLKKYKENLLSKDPKHTEEKHWQRFTDIIMADKILTHIY